MGFRAWWVERKAQQAEERRLAEGLPVFEVRVERVEVDVEWAPPPVPHPDDPRLALPNVNEDWVETEAWLRWEPPRKLVVGESNYQPALRALCGERREAGWCRAAEVTFVREPDNAYDANAVAATVAGRVVGYLPKRLVAGLAPQLDEFGLEEFTVCGVVRGGWSDSAMFGCHVWADRRPVAGPPMSVEGDDDFAGNWPPDQEELDSWEPDEEEAW